MYTKEDYKQFIYSSLVRKGIIETKCSNPKYFSRKTKKVMDAFREETKDWNHEKALYLDNEGNILWEKEGNGNSVSLDEKLAWKLSDPQGIGYGQINIEHNHPTIKGFEAFPPVLSLGDTSKLLSYANEGFLFRSITAEGNGKRMSLIRSPNINARTSRDNGEFNYKGYKQASEHLDTAINKYIKMYGDKLAELNNISVDKLRKDIQTGKINTNYDMSQHALNEIGSLKSFLESEGVIKEMEDVGVSVLLEE